jgi:hypothetical protein
MNPFLKAATAAVAMMAAASVIGCGDEEPTAAGAAEMPGLPASFTGPGSYTVPAVPTVQFALPSVKVGQQDGTVSVYWDLPAAFPAEAPMVELTGTADETDTVMLAGPAGTSTCTLSASLFECHEQLSGIRFGTPDLPATNPQSAAVDAFVGDPIGVLRVEMTQ